MKLPEGKTLEDIEIDVREKSGWVEPHKLICNGCGHIYLHHSVANRELEEEDCPPKNVCYECDEICYSSEMWRKQNKEFVVDYGGRWWHPLDEFDYLVNEARKIRKNE